MGERHFTKMWADTKRAGTPAPTMEFIEAILTGEDDTMISHEELLKRVTGYFRGITAEVPDENGDIHTIWTQAPSKGQFALAIGIPWNTLMDYIRGYYTNGKHPHGREYGTARVDRQRLIAKEDFPILRKAYALIESFYEQKLAAGGNCTGSIFWLLNAKSGWTNDHVVEVRAVEEKPVMKLEDLPPLPEIEEQRTLAELPDFDEGE